MKTPPWILKRLADAAPGSCLTYWGAKECTALALQPE